MKISTRSRVRIPSLAALGVAGAAVILPWPLSGAEANPHGTIVLRGIARDFRRAHTDFDPQISEVADHVAGTVEPTLGTDARPVAASAPGTKVIDAWRDSAGRPIAPHLAATPPPPATCLLVADAPGTTAGDSDGGITSAATFTDWFRDVLGTNLSIARAIALSLNGTVYEYLDDDFYPIDGVLLGNEGDTHNNFFTYALDATFTYEACAGQFLEFEGGNGTWMFLDDVLVMDLGGVTPMVGQFVELDRLTLNDGQVYTLRLFYAHRDDAQSVFRLRTNIPLESSGTVLVSGGFD
jgi:fibro-slime domain-containing protein